MDLKNNKYDEKYTKKFNMKKDHNDLEHNDLEYFVHFNSVEECNNFINNIIKINIEIGHKCCSDTGCLIKNYNNIDIDHIIKKIKNDNKLLIDECDICFESKSLIINCKICSHPLCNDCFSKIKNKPCPYCRSK